MNEARIVLVVFGVLAVLLIAGPVVTVLTKTPPADADHGLDGAVSAAFLGNDGSTGSSTTAVGALFPKGLPQNVVFDKFAASGFTCATDSNAATCFRAHAKAGCDEDWKVRVIFKDDGTVWSTKTDRTKCP